MMEEEKEGKEGRDDIMLLVAICPEYVCDETLTETICVMMFSARKGGVPVAGLVYIYS